MIKLINIIKYIKKIKISPPSNSAVFLEYDYGSKLYPNSARVRNRIRDWSWRSWRSQGKVGGYVIFSLRPPLSSSVNCLPFISMKVGTDLMHLTLPSFSFVCPVGVESWYYGFVGIRLSGLNLYLSREPLPWSCPHFNLVCSPNISCAVWCNYYRIMNLHHFFCCLCEKIGWYGWPCQCADRYKSRVLVLRGRHRDLDSAELFACLVDCVPHACSRELI